MRRGTKGTRATQCARPGRNRTRAQDRPYDSRTPQVREHCLAAATGCAAVLLRLSYSENGVKASLGARAAEDGISAEFGVECEEGEMVPSDEGQGDGCGDDPVNAAGEPLEHCRGGHKSGPPRVMGHPRPLPEDMEVSPSRQLQPSRRRRSSAVAILPDRSVLAGSADAPHAANSIAGNFASSGAQCCQRGV